MENTDWFRASTGRINQLKSVEDKISSEILSYSANIRNLASNKLRSFSLVFIVLVFVTIFFCFLIVREITHQVSVVTDAILTSSKNRDLSVRAKKISRDELGLSAENLNVMLEGFSIAIDEIARSSIQLASAAEETSTTVSNNSKNLEKQNEQTQLIVAAVEEMTVTTQEVARSITEVAESAASAHEIALKSSVTVNATVVQIGNLVEEVQSVGEIFEELHVNSENIVNVIEVIKSVAEQTNLLALNAAIEAARAGEQGRGFSVVADEVRTLAQRTQSSTAEIESIISTFNSISERAFNAISAGRESAHSTASQTNDLIEELHKIEKSVTSISEVASRVAVAAEQQVAATQEISENASAISAMTEATATGSAQIRSVSEEQARLASQLQDISTAFKTS